MIIKLEFSIDQVNTLINALNQPTQASVMVLAGLISEIHKQTVPQVPKEEEKNVE